MMQLPYSILLCLLVGICGISPVFAEPVSIRLGYLNLSQIKAAHPATVRALAAKSSDEEQGALREISAAVEKVCSELGLEVALDGAGVYAGGQVCMDNGVDITNNVREKLGIAVTSLVSRTRASPRQINLSYFDLKQLKQSCPQLDVESKRLKAELQLRYFVDSNNQKLEDAKARGASRAELDDIFKVLQQEINIKQQAAIKKVQALRQEASARIATAVNKCITGKNAVVVDFGAVMFGYDNVELTGDDITRALQSEICKIAPTVSHLELEASVHRSVRDPSTIGYQRKVELP